MNNNVNENPAQYDKYGRFVGNDASVPPEAPAFRESAPREPKKHKRGWTMATKRDLAFAFICLVLSAVSANFYLWSGAGAGLAFAAVAILLVTVCYLAGKGMKVRVYTVLTTLVYLILSVSLAFSDAKFSKFWALCLLILLYAVFLISSMPLRVYEAGTYKSLADVVYAVFALTFGRIGRTWYAIFHKEEENKVKNRKTGSIFIGFALAVPVLCVIVPLLMSSDAAFEGLLDRVSAGNVFEIIFSVIIGAVICLLWFGQLYGAGEVKKEQKLPRDRKGVDPTILASFLSVLSLAYLLYIFSQLAYFFSGFSGLLPEGFTNAEYARRGFFEMATVCAINLLIVFVVILVCRKKNDRAPFGVRALSAFLCLFSIFLVATSLSKMFLYINNYGMTRLRVFTSVFMFFLAFVFFAVILRMFIAKMPYMKVIVLCAALIVSAMCFVDVDGVIAKYNVKAYLDGKLAIVDTDSLRYLSSDAVVPYALELCDDEDPEVAKGAQRILAKRADKLFKIKRDKKSGEYYIVDEIYDFRGFNVQEYRARKLLKDNFSVYSDIGEEYYW